MVNFDIIPYVFEVARIVKGVAADKKVEMRFDEYGKYYKMFEDMSDEERLIVVNRVRRSKK